MDASAAGEGKLAFTLRVPIGVVGAISPFNFPLNLVAHKLAPAIAAGCPVVLKPASQTPLSALDARPHPRSTSAACPPGHLNVVTGGGGTVGNAIVDHPDIALITFTGSPDVGWGIKARRAAQEGRARARQQRAADHRAERRRRDGGARRSRSPGSATPGSRASRRSASTCTSRCANASSTRSSRWSKASWSATRSTRRPTCRRSSREGERDRVQSWVDEAVAAGAEILAGGKVREDGVLAPTVLGDVTPDMRVCARRGVRPGRRRRRPTPISTTRSDSPTTRATDSRPRSSPRDLADALTAARTLDYGGVLVNEVPTFRADQQPYGGIRDSGNTREGPAVGGPGDDRGAPRHHPGLTQTGPRSERLPGRWVP